jgi:hypothetical protein
MVGGCGWDLSGSGLGLFVGTYEDTSGAIKGVIF